MPIASYNFRPAVDRSDIYGFLAARWLILWNFCNDLRVAGRFRTTAPPRGVPIPRGPFPDEHPPPHPPADSRLRPRRLHGRHLRRPRQPEAAAGHRSHPGRPAHHHHRGRQLAGRCQRRAGPRADGTLPRPRRALPDRHRLRPHQRGRPVAAPVPSHRRQRHLHLRRPHHRHRRLGPLPGPALRGSLCRQGRLGLRHLRRLLLPQPGRGRHRRRQHGRRRGSLPQQHRPQGHRRAPSRQAACRTHHDRPPDGKGAGRQGRDALEQRAGRSAGRPERRHRHARAQPRNRREAGREALGRVHRHRPHPQYRTLHRPAGHERRLHQDAGRGQRQCHGHQHPGRVRCR